MTVVERRTGRHCECWWYSEPRHITASVTAVTDLSVNSCLNGAFFGLHFAVL